MTRSISWTIAVAVAVAAALSACSGGDEGGQACTAAPIAITQGTWCITVTQTVNTCGSGVVPPYTGTLTQSGSNLTGTTVNATYTGSLCGASATMTGTAGNVSAVVNLQFSDPSHATGTTDWTTPTCSGRDTFTAHAGGCP